MRKYFEIFNDDLSNIAVGFRDTLAAYMDVATVNDAYAIQAAAVQLNEEIVWYLEQALLTNPSQEQVSQSALRVLGALFGRDENLSELIHTNIGYKILFTVIETTIRLSLNATLSEQEVISQLQTVLTPES